MSMSKTAPTSLPVVRLWAITGKLTAVDLAIRSPRRGAVVERIDLAVWPGDLSGLAVQRQAVDRLGHSQPVSYRSFRAHGRTTMQRLWREQIASDGGGTVQFAEREREAGGARP